MCSGAWKTATFKPYNFNALGSDQNAGALHPLNKVRHEFRQIFFEMGFEEMPTNRYVETGFLELLRVFGRLICHEKYIAFIPLDGQLRIQP